MVTNIFPLESAIPEQFQIGSYLEQREYLVDGELRAWTGDLSPVLSPVFVQEGDGYTQKVIGSTPLLTEVEAMEALDAAVKAYDLGHGLWPTMPVAERIEHMEDFLARMRDKEVRGGEAVDVGNRQGPQGFREGIRPHLRLYRGYHQSRKGA